MAESESEGDVPRVVHLTTSHRADDVRIFERECRSLAQVGHYEIYLAAAGTIPTGSGVRHIPLREIPKSRLGRFRQGPLKARRLTQSVSADLWHFHDPELIPVALRLALSGRPVVWDAHEDYLAQFKANDNKGWIPTPGRAPVRALMSTMLGALDRSAAGVVGASSTIAGQYRNPLTVVVGNEARLEDFADCRPDFASRRVIFTGHLAESNLFPQVVEAVSQVEGVSLAVAGRVSDSHVWAEAEKLLGGRLEHLGWLSRAQLAAEFSRSSIGLATYAPLPTFVDPHASPTKVYEFAAAGLPVVGVPVPSLVKYVEDSGGGFVSKGFSSRDLAETIRVALSDRQVWEVRSAAARQWSARTGGWTSSESRLLDLYQKILRG